jgi:hypothetical protein
MASVPHKKNLAGGKGHKKQSSKERGGPKKNRELTTAFLDDLAEGELDDGLTVARVQKNFGGGRASLLTVANETFVAGLKGSLKCSAGAARRADNPIALFPNCFVLVHNEGYGQQIIGVFNRTQVKVIEKHLPIKLEKPPPRGFFSLTAEEGEEDAFDWDEEPSTADEELNIESI